METESQDDTPTHRQGSVVARDKAFMGVGERRLRMSGQRVVAGTVNYVADATGVYKGPYSFTLDL